MRLDAIAALALAASSTPTSPQGQPWVEEGDVGCHWRLSRPDGKEYHASIGQGDDDPLLTVSEKSFVPFAETERVTLVLRFNGDSKREAAATAWSSSVVGDGERMLGMYLDAAARKAMGGATRIEMLHQGKLLADIPLAATPSQAMLDGCVRPPKSEDSDEEGG